MLRAEMHTLRTVFVILSLAIGCLAQVSEYYSDSDTVAAQQVLFKAQDQDGLFSGSLKASSQAAEILKLLGKSISHDLKLCSAASKALSEASAVSPSVYFASRLIFLLGCDSSLGEATEKKIAAAVDEASTIEELYSVVGTVASLRKAFSSSFEGLDLSSVVPKVVGLMDDESLFKSSSSSESGTLANVGLAYEILAHILSFGDLSDDSKESIENVASKVESVFALAEDSKVDGRAVSEFADSSSKLSSLTLTSRILRGASQFGRALDKKFKISGTQVTRLAEYLIQKRGQVTVSGVYDVITGLDAVSSGAFPIPVVLGIVQKSGLSSTAKGSEGFLKVSVTDVLGRFVDPVEVTLIKAAPEGSPDKPVLTNQEVSPVSDESNNVLYHFNLLAPKPDQGIYVLEFQVKPAGEKSLVPIKSVKRTIKVTAVAVVEDFELLLSDFADVRDDADLSDARRFSLSYPSTSTESIPVEQDQKIRVSFKVKAQGSGRLLQPHQVFLSLTNAKTKAQTVLVAKFQDKQYKLNIDLNELGKSKLKGLSGDYVLDLIVGDAVLQNSFIWNIVTLTLHLKELVSDKPKFDLRDVSADKLLLQAQPEIEHKFRLPDKRPPPGVSYLFTALVLSPLGLLAIVWIKLGVNLGGFPKAGPSLIKAIVFQLCLISTVILNVFYWIGLTFGQALSILVLIGLVGLFSGHGALSDVASGAGSLRKLKTT